MADPQPASFWDHFWQNFDKFLVAGLLLTFAGVTVFLVLHKADDAALQWAESITGSMGSALLALLGAKAWAARANGNGNGNGAPVNGAPANQGPSVSISTQP